MNVSIVRGLTATAIVLAAINVALRVVTLVTGHDYMLGLVPLFDLDHEHNVPSLFSGGLFLFNAVLLLRVGMATVSRRAVWLAVAGLFVFLAYDELFGVHEVIGWRLRDAFALSGAFLHGWYLVYGPLVLLLALVVFPTWQRLERGPRRVLAAAATVYLSGAIGLEMIAAAYYPVIGYGRGLAYGILTTLEECMEMAGLILLVHGLLMILSEVRPRR